MVLGCAYALRLVKGPIAVLIRRCFEVVNNPNAYDQPIVFDSLVG